jgi:hypothetical protein
VQRFDELTRERIRRIAEQITLATGQIKSSWTIRSGTASDDFIYTARSSSITSRTLTLNLNGTSFLTVRQGNTELARNTDYTVSGDQLTFTASALTRLHGSRAYGVNAAVQVYFSTGVPWRVNIITYDTPILNSATGTTGGFAIPTQFRGDQLATMEAKYADGSNAGPNNWTSFKEFDVTFAPDYPANQILLRPAFFAGVNDGATVTLTFHLWSGARGDLPRRQERRQRHRHHLIHRAPDARRVAGLHRDPSIPPGRLRAVAPAAYAPPVLPRHDGSST